MPNDGSPSCATAVDFILLSELKSTKCKSKKFTSTYLFTFCNTIMAGEPMYILYQKEEWYLTKTIANFNC